LEYWNEFVCLFLTVQILVTCIQSYEASESELFRLVLVQWLIESQGGFVAACGMKRISNISEEIRVV
jgi:hypothetical protein